MYNRGDEDDEGSYMYFMGGEVVIPRHQDDQSNNNSEHSRQRSTSPYNTNSEYVPAPTHPTSRVESVASSLSADAVGSGAGFVVHSDSSRSSRRGRFVNELEPVVASAISRDDDSDLHRTYDVTPDSASHGSNQPPISLLDEQITDDDDPYVGEGNSSALQAILSALDDRDSVSTTTHIGNDSMVQDESRLPTSDTSIFRSSS
jgi:hypothetical protein